MALEGAEVSASRPSLSSPPGKTRYPLYRRLGGPQGWSGQVQKISPPPGFDPQTFQPVASRYTDYATRPISSSIHTIITYQHFLQQQLLLSSTKHQLCWTVSSDPTSNCHLNVTSVFQPQCRNTAPEILNN